VGAAWVRAGSFPFAKTLSWDSVNGWMLPWSLVTGA
jgi:hypothetical protein